MKKPVHLSELKTQEERDEAIQNLFASIKKSEKSKNIITVIAILLALAITISLIIYYSVDSSYRDKERNIATDSIEKGFTNVYADIVYFEPIYVVEQSKYKNNVQIGSTTTASVICKCQTIEGKTIWLEIPAYLYTGTIEYLGTNVTTGYDEQSFETPLRVRGRVTTFDNVADNPPAHQNTLILRISSNSDIEKNS